MKKSTWLVLAVVIAVILIALLLRWSNMVKKSEVQELNNNTQTNQPTEQTQTTPPPTKTGTKKPTANQSYVDALNTYRSLGYLFQFTQCHGNPGSMNIKTKDKFMLDNRDAVKHTLNLAGKNYTIIPYGFAIATAPAVGHYNITCDGGGAAELDVQK